MCPLYRYPAVAVSLFCISGRCSRQSDMQLTDVYCPALLNLNSISHSFNIYIEYTGSSQKNATLLHHYKVGFEIN